MNEFSSLKDSYSKERRNNLREIIKKYCKIKFAN